MKRKATKKTKPARRAKRAGLRRQPGAAIVPRPKPAVAPPAATLPPGMTGTTVPAGIAYHDRSVSAGKRVRITRRDDGHWLTNTPAGVHEMGPFATRAVALEVKRRLVAVLANCDKRGYVTSNK